MDRSNKHKASEEVSEDLSKKSKASFESFAAYDVYPNIASRLCLKPSRTYKIGKDEVPFFIPHKKLLEKIEYKPEIREPLTGFSAQQEKIRKQVCKPCIPLKMEEETLPVKEVPKTDTSCIPILSDSQAEKKPWQFKKYKKKKDLDTPPLVDQLELIQKLREDPSIGFFYMIYAVERSSKYFTPYALKIVQYKDLGENYMTISASGVTQYSPDEMSFTPIEQWEKEYVFYLKLLQIRTFVVFQLWKAFYVWTKSVKYKKFVRAKNYLEENLFISDPILSKALLEIKSMCSVFLDSSFFDNTVLEKLLLFYFVEKEFAKLEFIRSKLDEFRRLAVDIVNNACLGALLRAGYTPDDSNITVEQTAYGKLGEFGVVKFKMPKDGILKMSYIEQARKREKCYRLSCFIHLIDYMQTNMMHGLLLNTYREYLQALKIHTEFLPDEESIDNDVIDMPLKENRPASHRVQLPYFVVDLLITPTAEIVMDPLESIFRFVIQTIKNMWEENLYAIKPLLSDPFFHSFTRPMINHKIEERICGNPPKVQDIIKQDPFTIEIKAEVEEMLNKNFDAVTRYCRRFDGIRQFYHEDMDFDEDIIRDNRDCKLFREWSIRYMNELDVIQKVIDAQPFGLFLIQLERFKNAAEIAPRGKLGVIEAVMPGIGKSRVDALLTQAINAINYLETIPVTTEEYVAYIKFVDKAQASVDDMEGQLDYVKELYDTMEEFAFPIPSMDMANYLGIGSHFTSLRLVVENRLEERPKLINRFNSQLQRDITALNELISEIHDEITQPWLLNPESDPDACLNTLKELNRRLGACAAEAEECRAHQRSFKLEQTRFDILDQVMNELKLRTLLWESLTSWEQTVYEWYSADFDTLDVEEITGFTMRTMKNIIQLERGLPSNKIVPVLRESVESIRNKLSVLGYLRNPDLRDRHWKRIEKILNYTFKPDEKKTWARMEQLGAFFQGDELMEVAAAASSEANLEHMLKKVVHTWEGLEFIVIPYKEGKDVFILGSLEEIQVAMDESNINLQTINASRHVGPIRPVVEEWVQKLDLFTATLEAWQYLQQNWLYLEAIFSAPDIQRQLPMEAKLFIDVDKFWKDLMRRTHKSALAMPTCTQPGLLEQIEENNAMLDEVMKCLEAYLETKRIAFPRFFFLSNDELLEILAQTKNPHAVQRHLQKCFDAIFRLEFAKKVSDTDEEVEILTTDIIAMISPEGEKVPLGKGLKARGNVEDWLGRVEEAMFSTLRRRMKAGIKDFADKGRGHFLYMHPSQIVLAVCQIFWTRNIHHILDSGEGVLTKMKAFEQKCFADLNELAVMVRGELPRLIREVITNVVTIDVHARDIVTTMVENKVVSSTSFDWLKALRYYWDEEAEACLVRMSNAEYLYGYEYLGAQRRLVITPLTDKCYLCLMGALQLDLGGAPAGPAGTGKTETTKDLAKAVAVQCVVFNCSEGLDYRMMGRFFSGLATSGAWCCFDEFNRIDIEVLSVIAQQLITIRNAKIARASKFMFEGRMIKLVMSCSTFITMNPGYAGRTELPDNLKALFRPFSMMVPDYKLIAEVTLYSEGFESSKPLSQKMTLMYQLSSEQLSQQDHYDFGMRAVKSVLVMAGSLKRNNPDKPEDVVLIRALRESNIPKFLRDDTELFEGIVGDLFPGIQIPEEDYGILSDTALAAMEDKGLQREGCILKKVTQLHECLQVRHGVMLVGPTGSGKTTVLQTLATTYNRLHEMGVPGSVYQPVHTYVINPKAVTIGELYGQVDIMTNEWHDGLIGFTVRHACSFTTEDHQWIICDGPVDAVWIENMNTVLDDNKMLCLANSERIKFTPYMRMLFEVMDLAQASPATVSRCGMVYVDPMELKWMPYVKSWIQKIPDTILKDEHRTQFIELFAKYFEDGLLFSKRTCYSPIAQVDISKANMTCAILEYILNEPEAIEKTTEKLRIRTFLTQSFVFAYIWAVGGNLSDSSRVDFEVFVRKQFEGDEEALLPSVDLWDIYINVPSHRLDIWADIMPEFRYDSEVPFFDILVPTVDTVRFGYLMKKLVEINKPVFFTGDTGVGKSVITKVVLKDLEDTQLWVPINLIFSAQTSSGRTQEILELKLEKRKRTVLGAPIGKRVCVFVDDVNMPKLDTYGSQPPIELLRQLLDFNGMYDREKLFWKAIEDVVFAVACAPPGGGRNPLTPRFVRHFAMLLIPAPTELSLKGIFKAIMNGFLEDFVESVKMIGDRIVDATVDVYQRIATDLLPTPEKSHYIFNLRDLSKCIQGIMQVDATVVKQPTEMHRLFYHECLRVFHDRLINVQDKTYFYRLLNNICVGTFATEVVRLPDEKIIEKPPLLLFGDFMAFGAAREQRIYEELTDIPKVKGTLEDYLEDYRFSVGRDMKIIFFMDAIEHVCRLARILRSERGNGLLVGVGGMGKQSLTKLASHLNGYKCYQIEVTRTYDKNSWHEDLRRFYFDPGTAAKHTTFLFTDTQIVQEEFLEDINNTLNTGEVPNLYEADELEKVIIGTRPAAKEIGIHEGNRDAIYQFFIGRVRNHLHLMICMSPIGDAFRHRCRMFPSLVNCCTIDWFTTWPKDALLSVAETSLLPITPGDPGKLAGLSAICVFIHETVEEVTARFFIEMRRRYYTTPSSYLELLKLFQMTLGKRREGIEMLKRKIANGLNKLRETNEMVTVMKEQLTVLAPKLKTSTDEVAQLVKVIAKQQIESDKVKYTVTAEEAAATEKAEETGILEADARKDLEAAMPALLEAQKALEALNKDDINEIRVFARPPHLVRFVMEAVNLLLGEKTDWNSARLVLGDIHFLDRLYTYPKDEISDKLLEKLQAYIDHPEFKPELVARQSKACKSMCIWVRAIDGYAKIYRVVEPKRQRLQKAAAELKQIEDVVRQKREELIEVENKIKKLQKQYDTAMENLSKLQAKMELAETRLNRSGRLTSALVDERIRWEEMTRGFDKQIFNLTGDTLVAAGALAYLGAFTNEYREELIQAWLASCKQYNITTTENYSIITILADPYEIRLWNTYGLPRDKVSTENAIFVTQASRWPLMIDPQEQANRWIRNMEQDNNLKICKLTDVNLMRILEASIRLGAPVLLQEVGEVLDPSLEPILLKQLFVLGGRTLIRFGDTDVEYDDDFRLYITTKIANPHYLPEVCIKVTIVNFTVTLGGLEEQLLADVVRLERPDLETMRNDLIMKINADKGQLQNIEDRILTLLFSSGGDILDNEDLIETLNDSKETSAIIATRLIESEATEQKISEAREKYRSVANRGSVLYFIVADLANIDPMYQFSLKYFNQIFNVVIETTEKEDNLQKRLQSLISEITLAVYTNVSRGLFEKHKLVYSFMLNIAIHMNNKIVTNTQWNFMLRGPSHIIVEEMPDYPTLTNHMWLSVNYLARSFESFKHILNDVFKRIPIKLGYFEEEINVIPTNETYATREWDKLLSDIEKLMLLRALKENLLIFAITAYVAKNLGQKFVESPMASLQLLFADTSNKIPLVFILTTGSDPFSGFLKFAHDMEFTDRYDSISLGQGQGPVAEGHLRNGTVEGRWVFLQNCHLATSWMIKMEQLVLEIAEEPEGVIHPDFRLFLSSMPSIAFPVSVLQNSVKVTNEPPKGLKANIKRALYDLDEEFFEYHHLDDKWRRIIFGVCFFHAIVQERKKFGPLGWNILYEFNDSDRECCLLNLKLFCIHEHVPWNALIYTTGEITYGGRVTDNWDLRCMKTILDIFFSPKTLAHDYVYSPSGRYYCPAYKTLDQYKDFVEDFSIIDDPEVFGMHENANIIYQLKEAQFVLNTILEVQPQESVTEEGKSRSEIAYEIADMVKRRIEQKIDPLKCNPEHMIRDSAGRLPSMTTVLVHEVERYNILLQKIHSSIDKLQKAIKGFVVMSEELESVFIAFINNQVPQMWHNVNVYPSLKTLGSWIRNLELRIDFIQVWFVDAKPISFWISGLSFPQGFLTGMLQTCARKYNTPIDHLKLDFITSEIVLDQDEIEIEHKKAEQEVPEVYKGLKVPEDGVLIHGLYIDAGRWDFQTMMLVDANIGEMHPSLPVMHINPVLELPEDDPRYVCPLYKTAVRAGVLSTTGHSTNFVVQVLLPSEQPQPYWILKGTALLIEIIN
ncbi:dynein heavy chain 6, axonemal [Ceratina calcarata]|uniref:Dynein heavy chain 6, axonemal n=1 Tax=Ceratina calcarata TaxID=156304 RepID=A0AAJ7RWC1_9HYME|nr:dynein heavy chain 6, axonemal [Ceratina calcarata]